MQLIIGSDMKKFNKTFTLPFKSQIPNYVQQHLDSVSLMKRFLKYIKRHLYILLKGQGKLETFNIIEEQTKILWINISAPSLGDSLMDLSGRVLLTEKKVDLFTDINNKHLYENDDFFNNSYTELADLKNNKYDLVIIDSYSTRSLKIKSVVAPDAPYVGMFGYFNGPEVNRILFSFYQMNSLLGDKFDELQLNNLARNYLSISTYDRKLISEITPEKYIAIVLGGEWEYKTYKKWDQLIEKISFQDADLTFVFIGSRNATTESKKILAKFPDLKFINLTRRLTFAQSVEVARCARVLFCCDGGLFHGASAMSANIIVLLARLSSEMLLTKNNLARTLYDSNNVNNIPVDCLLREFNQVL